MRVGVMGNHSLVQSGACKKPTPVILAVYDGQGFRFQGRFRLLVGNLDSATALEDDGGSEAGNLLLVLGVDVGEDSVLSLYNESAIYPDISCPASLAPTSLHATFSFRFHSRQ